VFPPEPDEKLRNVWSQEKSTFPDFAVRQSKQNASKVGRMGHLGMYLGNATKQAPDEHELQQLARLQAYRNHTSQQDAQYMSGIHSCEYCQ
jgi:hypothetical protein